MWIASPSQPIRCKTKTNNLLVIRVFVRLRCPVYAILILSSHWLPVIFSLISAALVINLVLLSVYCSLYLTERPVHFSSVLLRCARLFLVLITRMWPNLCITWQPCTMIKSCKYQVVRAWFFKGKVCVEIFTSKWTPFFVELSLFLVHPSFFSSFLALNMLLLSSVGSCVQLVSGRHEFESCQNPKFFRLPPCNFSKGCLFTRNLFRNCRQIHPNVQTYFKMIVCFLKD